MEFYCLYLLFYSHSIFWFQLMILKEQNNQKKALTDGVLDVNHEQESTPSANGKASPRARALAGSQFAPVCAGLLGSSPQHTM